MAGFESACHINRSGQRLDMIAATQHDKFLDEDYARLRQLGISSVRDTARWHLVERPGRAFDFATVESMLSAARRQRMQIVWDMCHYGWPDDLDILSSAFVDRLARYCGAVARYVREQGDEVPFYTPINEISFLSWAAGEVGCFFPVRPRAWSGIKAAVDSRLDRGNRGHMGRGPACADRDGRSPNPCRSTARPSGHRRRCCGL